MRNKKFNKEDWGLLFFYTPQGGEMRLCHKTFLHAWSLLRYEWRKIGLARYQEILSGNTPAEKIWNEVGDVEKRFNSGAPPGLNVHC